MAEYSIAYPANILNSPQGISGRHKLYLEHMTNQRNAAEPICTKKPPQGTGAAFKALTGLCFCQV